MSIGSLCGGREYSVTVAAECGTRGNYLSAFVRGRAITSRDVFPESAFLRQVFPRIFSSQNEF
jgi:hypothetical protein